MLITQRQQEEKAVLPIHPLKKPKEEPLINSEGEADIDLEREVEKLIENSAYKSPADGLWYIYDHEKKEWRAQDEDPSAGLSLIVGNKKILLKDQLLDKSKKIHKNDKSFTEEELVKSYL